eukprot:TRINITY_DN18784_c0_g1_i3.p3 TRINITY_DN18784_c0_g1~~TRINITY_DN18784_c0_g1_i3.p3  ORF type:complete len:154 (+),score=13.26 TRINITY_DN18784_c0_g1_i3:67-528(+)
MLRKKKRKQGFRTGTQIKVEVRSFDRSPCLQVTRQIDLIANYLGVGRFKLTENPLKIDHMMQRDKKWILHSVIRSPFKFKRSQEQFKIEHFKWESTYRVLQGDIGRVHLFLHFIKTAQFPGVELLVTVEDMYKGSVSTERFDRLHIPHYEQIE